MCFFSFLYKMGVVSNSNFLFGELNDMLTGYQTLGEKIYI